MRHPFLFLCAATMAFGAEPSADDLMRQVAERFDQASQARREWVYRQVVRSSLVRGGSSEFTARQKREYTVAPVEDRTAKTLTSFEAQYRKGKQLLTTADPKDPDLDEGMDRGMLDSLTGHLVDDRKSRDGIPRKVFPLTADELAHYRFSLLSNTEYRGRKVLRVAFEPAGKEACIHVGGGDDDSCESRPWKGEAWIDAEDLQPVRITTDLGKKIPLAVRLLLGTNVSQLGFSSTWTRVAPGVWFPATYGTEFQLRVLWGYRRTITLAMDSSEFRRADVKSKIEYDEAESAQP